MHVAARPVVLVDGPDGPYPWKDCAECAAGTLGVPVAGFLAAVAGRPTG